MKPTQPSPEKPNYSYEEMMERLRLERSKGAPRVQEEIPARTGGGEEGSSTSQPVRIEVVEDDDGNRQVVEVRRRRKRRSHQPKKVKEERIKKIRKALVFGGIPLLLAVLAGIALMYKRVGGESFRVGASTRISELVGAEVEFGRFQLRGFDLSSRKAVVKGASGGLLREAEVVTLKSRIRFSSMLSSDWDLGVVQAADGQLRFGPAGSGQSDVGIGGLSMADETRGPAPLVRAGLGLDKSPKIIDVHGTRIASTDLYWDGRLPSSDPVISDTALSTGELAGPTTRLSLRGGKLAVPGWPEFGIESISGDIDGDGNYKIVRSILLHIDDGRVSVTGDLSLRGAGDFRLLGDFSDVSLRELAHPHWADKLGGEIDGKIDISGSLARPGSMSAEGQFTSGDLVLSNNRMLKHLSIAMSESLLARVEFRTFSARFRRSADKLELFDIEGEHPSLLRLRGGCTMHADGQIEGVFQVGMPAPMVSKIDGGKPAFFGVPDDGYVWTTVKLGGLIDDPREDLSERLNDASGRFRRERDQIHPGRGIQTLPSDGGRPPSAPPGAGAGLEGTFNELIRP